MTAPRFLAFIGIVPTKAEVLKHTSENGFEQVMVSGMLELWTSSHLIRLANHGAIVGHLFTRSMPSRRVLELDEDEVGRIVSTKGARLIAEYWGGYVAFLDSGHDGWSVLRDPSGALPTYWRRHTAGGIALTSDVDTFPFRPVDGVRVDAAALCAYLVDPHHAGSQTCLAGVSELLPGAMLTTLGNAVEIQTRWSPWDHVTAGRRHDEPDPGVLKETVIDAVRAWGNCFESLLLSLSGGLDSSIVCAGLRHSTASIRGLTMVWPDAGGDESAFARIAAEACGIPLEVGRYRIDQVGIEAVTGRPMPRPVLAHFGQPVATARARIAGRAPIDAYCTGNGGDNVFCSMQSVTPIVDSVLAFRGWRQTWKTVGDVCQNSGASFPLLLQHLCKRAFLRAPARQSARDFSYLAQDRARAALAAVAPHPWNVRPDGRSSRGAAHIRMIRRALGEDSYQVAAPGLPSIAPLLSQPVVELCLQIPSWAWVSGGRDRALARTAFADELPSDIVNRRTKGGPSGFTDRLYWENECAVLEFLRSGRLVQSGILEHLPAHSLSNSPNRQPTDPRRLLYLAAAEAWVRSWEA